VESNRRRTSHPYDENSIRPYRLASLRHKGEAQTPARAGEAGGAEGLGDKATNGAGRWLETRARKVGCVKQGDLLASKPVGRAGVTALVVAMKPGNSGGAKGCRKMERR
jgi:hypothetical protein